MTPYKSIWPLVVAALLASACAHKDSAPVTEASNKSAQAPAPTPTIAAAAEAPSSPSGVPAVPNRKIIRNADYAIEVPLYAPAAKKLEELAATSGGFVADLQVERREERVESAVFVLRLPAAQLDGALRTIRDLGLVTNERVEAMDVTEAYTDLQARLDNAKASEARLIRLLAEATGKLDDLLAVEKELSRVRGDVESLAGKLRLLADQVDLCTVTVRLRLPPLVVAEQPEPGFVGQLGQALTDSVTTLLGFGQMLIRLVVVLLPWSVVAVPLLVLRRWWRRRHATQH
jgi:hypothetical protein